MNDTGSWLSNHVALVADGTGDWQDFLLSMGVSGMERLSPSGDWPERPERRLFLVDTAPSAMLPTLIRLAESRADFATSRLPSLTDVQRLSLRRLLSRRHCHAVLLAAWRYHWAVCRIREALDAGLLGANVSGVLSHPAGDGMQEAPMVASDLSAWLGLAAGRLSLGEPSSDSCWRLELSGECGRAGVSFSPASGQGTLRLDSEVRRCPLLIGCESQSPRAVCLGALRLASPVKGGWIGFPALSELLAN